VPLRISRALEFASISAGDSTGCAITIAGRAYCWGNGKRGTVGNGTTDDQSAPTLVTNALTFTSISVGGQHACGLATGGLAYCWGADSLGQLGDSRLVNSTTPIPVSGGGSTAVFASISAGFRHTCAVTATGTAFCWGSNERGQLGAGTSGGFVDTPVQVLGGLQFASISAGGDHTCGVTSGGAAYCWGSKFDGQLGNGATGGFSAVPVAVAGGLTFARISASTGTRTRDLDNNPMKITGAGHTCGLTTGGAVYCWGDNENLQLGRGPFSSGPQSASGVPQQVLGGELTAGLNFVSVSAGSVHSCGVTTDGAAYCWGSNIFGALGNKFQAAFR
jgi:alpha-tubulin suppressor-like RCC1 family protein